LRRGREEGRGKKKKNGPPNSDLKQKEKRGKKIEDKNVPISA